MKTLLTISHGYSAQALALELQQQGGWRLIGTTRSAEGAERLSHAGIEPLIWSPEHGNDGALSHVLSEASHILSSVAPDAHGTDPVLARHNEALHSSRAEWIGYLSATSVYGDCAGALVNEHSPLAPSSARGQARVQTEAGWRALPRTHIFRLAGIYGPGRSALDALRAGRARRIIKEGLAFSRIHVADIAMALQASMRQPCAQGATWNLCDDAPAPPQDVIAYGAGLLGLPIPPDEPYETAELTPMARSFYEDNKRVCNKAVKSALGLEWRHPDYRSGLDAILASETAR